MSLRCDKAAPGQLRVTFAVPLNHVPALPHVVCVHISDPNILNSLPDDANQGCVIFIVPYGPISTQDQDPMILVPADHI
jgi:hypothetical protein